MLDDEIYNYALKIFQEFGPKRSIDRTKRLQDCFPSLSKRDIQELIAEFKAAETIAWDIAEKVHDGSMSAGDGKKMLSKQCPKLNQNLVDSTFNQAMYFVSK